jgi:hypothetical protein
MVDAKEYEKNKERFPEEPKLTHVEHIIHNALFGRLKSSNILCKTCGSEFGEKEDKAFVCLFFPITERIKHIAIPKDHGKGNSNSVKGVLFEDEKFESSKDIYIRDQKVIASEPFYEYDAPNKKVLIYAAKKRAKQYRPLVEKELLNQGIDLSDLTFQTQEDVSDQGVLAVHFTKGIPDFNERFKPGFVKMAVGYSIHCGIDRTVLPKVLDVDSDGIGHLITKGNLIPFVPIGPTDALYEINRPELEEHYPTHTLILFSQQVGDRKYLFCYADLFSTFQFYVLLNDNYQGEEIFRPFYQTVIKQERPEIDVRRIRMKHLSIVMEQYGIDRSGYSGNTIEELYEFVQAKLNSLTFSPILNLVEDLASSFSKLNTAFLFAKSSNSGTYTPSDSIVTDIHEGQKLAFFAEMRNYFNEDESFSLEPFRRIFLEDDEEGKLEAMSTPWECTHTTITEKERTAYGHLKFNQISRFIDENEAKKKNNL